MMKNYFARRGLPYLVLLWGGITMLAMRFTFDGPEIMFLLAEPVGLVCVMAGVVGYFTNRVLIRLDLLNDWRHLAAREGIVDAAAVPVHQLYKSALEGSRSHPARIAVNMTDERSAFLRDFVMILSGREIRGIQILLANTGDLQEKSVEGEHVRLLVNHMRRFDIHNNVELRLAARAVPMNYVEVGGRLLIFSALGVEGRNALQLELDPISPAGKYYKEIFHRAWDESAKLDNEV